MSLTVSFNSTEKAELGNQALSRPLFRISEETSSESCSLRTQSYAVSRQESRRSSIAKTNNMNCQCCRRRIRAPHADSPIRRAPLAQWAPFTDGGRTSVESGRDVGRLEAHRRRVLIARGARAGERGRSERDRVLSPCCC